MHMIHLLNDIKRELELPPNSLPKIDSIRNFYNELIQSKQDAKQYLKYLENDYIMKSFALVDDITIKRNYGTGFTVYFVSTFGGVLDLKEHKCYIYDISDNEFYKQAYDNIHKRNDEIAKLKNSIKAMEKVLLLKDWQMLIEAAKDFLSNFDLDAFNYKKTRSRLLEMIQDNNTDIISEKIMIEKMYLFKVACLERRKEVMSSFTKQCHNLNIECINKKLEFFEESHYVPDILESYIYNLDKEQAKFDLGESNQTSLTSA